MGIHKGIAHGAAGVGADLTGTVAIVVSGGSADEGHVDLQLPGLDSPGAAAVGAQDDGLGQLHLAGEDGVAQLAADAAGLDAVDGAVLHKVHDGGFLDVHHGAGSKAQALDAQRPDGGEHLADDLVPLPEAVVEGDGHAVLQPGGENGILQGGHQLVPAGNTVSGSAAGDHRLGLRKGLICALIGADAIASHLLGQLPA